MRVIGLDGGGSNLRVGVYTEDLQPLAEVRLSESVNPSGVGRTLAAQRIQAALRDVLAQVNGDVVAVCAGIAGAERAAPWIEETVRAVLPGVKVVASSDYEIALVGALGERFGVLLLAGTGSVAYGVNRAGQSVRVGGWGYLIGDEGSGYWLGLEAIKVISRVLDGVMPATPMTHCVWEALNIPRSREALLEWLYGSPRTREIAALASCVLTAAAENDATAGDIVAHGAAHIAGMHTDITRQLDMANPPVAFAGGLLTSENPLSLELCRVLGLEVLPQPKHSPVVGAALLALQSVQNDK